MRGHMSYEGARGMLTLGKLLFESIGRLCLRIAGPEFRVLDLTDKREDPLLAIQFSIEYAGTEQREFLKSWNEGDWEQLQRDWPEWVKFMSARGIDVHHEPRAYLHSPFRSF